MSKSINDPQLTPDEHDFQNALASLAPASAGISRDATLFAAGRASAPQRSPRVWQLTTLLLALVAGGLFFLRPTQYVDRDVERAVRVYDTKVKQAAPLTQAYAPTSQVANPIAYNAAIDKLPEQSSFRLQSRWLAYGELPAAPISKSPPDRNAVPLDDAKFLYDLKSQLGGRP